MKILHVITALNFGGAEAMLSKLVAQHQATLGMPRAVVVSLMPPGTVGRKMVNEGVLVESLNLQHFWQFPRALRALDTVVRRHRPDVIQGWMYHGNIAATAAAAFTRHRSRLLWNIRHSLHDIRREKLSTRLVIGLGARLSQRPCATIYNSSAAVGQHVECGYDGRSAIVIPNGFDHRQFRPDGAERLARRRLERGFGISPSAIVVAVVARHHPMKDHETAIEAAGRARQMGHDVHLLLAGSGTDALPAKLAGVCERWLPADRLTLLGDRRDVADWLPGCDIVLLSSAWGEGFPNILGEAMASGVPCITTDVGDSKAIIGDGGICVPRGDPATMAIALAELSGSGHEGRRHIGARGRARVRAEYSLSAIAARYSELYGNALVSPSGRFLSRGRLPCAE